MAQLRRLGINPDENGIIKHSLVLVALVVVGILVVLVALLELLLEVLKVQNNKID